MTKELYADVIAHLLTSISMTSDPKEKERLTEICRKVISASGINK